VFADQIHNAPALIELLDVRLPEPCQNSSSAMLYTRFMIGDETESNTIAFNLSPFAGVSTTVKSFILRLFLVLLWAVATS